MHSTSVIASAKKELAQSTGQANLEKLNLGYAYDDEDINNRVFAEIIQNNQEAVYWYDIKLNTFSHGVANPNPNQQITNFLVRLQKQWQIIIAPAVSNALSDIEAVLDPILIQTQAYIEWVKTQTLAKDLIGIRLLFPYKLDGWHWNLGEVTIVLNHNKAVISCEGRSHDPFGNGIIENGLKKCLKKLLEKITDRNIIQLEKSSSFQLPRQKKGVYCGLVVARDLLRRLKDLPLDDANYCAIYNDEMAVRNEDLEFFRTYLDENKFKNFLLKQEKNNFDHYISPSKFQSQQSGSSLAAKLALLQSMLNGNSPGTSTNISPTNPIIATTSALPLKLEDIIASSSTKPNLFLMDHLLAAGFRGTIYQLLVFINGFLTKIIKEPSANFYAMVEKKGHGNLDDICLITTDANGIPIEIVSNQVKYYKKPINTVDFINLANQQTEDDEDESQLDEDSTTDSKKKKAKKMHIGKFFLGWLKWRKEFPNLPEDKLHSILFSNTSLEELLQSCIDPKTKGFKSSFIERQENVKVSLKLKTKATPSYALPYNFYKEKSFGPSKRIWQSLHEANYLDEGGHFTALLDFNNPNFRLNLERLPRGVTSDAVLARLKEINAGLEHEKHDVFQLLYEHAYSFLRANSTSNDFSKADQVKLKSDDGKLQLYQSFLASLQFQINQPNLADLESKILENISIIYNSQPDQIYLCLYYAIQEWFVKHYSSQQVPCITKSMIMDFVSTAKTKSEELFLLQGQTIACMSKVSYQSKSRFVPRTELSSILEAMKRPGFLLICGRKGIGKSGLIKQALEQQHPAQYLMLPAADINNNQNIREMLKRVLSLINSIKVIVIDSAELMSPLSQMVSEFLKFLIQLKKTIVFTTTPGCYDKNQIEALFKESCEIINVGSLSLENVQSTYPQLQSFLKRKSIARLATIPFHLASLVRLAESTKFQELIRFSEANSTELEVELIKMDVEGVSAGYSTERRMAWHHLAYLLATTPNGATAGALYPKVTIGLTLLMQDGMVYCKENRYLFRHDLYFEHGLMSYWTQKWEISFTEGTNQFWLDLPNSLNSFVTQNILVDWLFLHIHKLVDNILLNRTTLVKMQYFPNIMATAILAQTEELLQSLIKEIPEQLSRSVMNICGYYQTTFILLAILENKPRSLKVLLENGLIPHHPLAGQLIINVPNHNAYYEKEKSENSSNTDSDKEFESSDDLYNSYDENSETSDNEVRHEVEATFWDEPTPDRDFTGNPSKYWSAGFDEDPGEFNDEGSWHENKRYQKSPNNMLYYLHQSAIQKNSDCLSILLVSYNTPKRDNVVNLQNEYKETPLHLATLKGITSAVMELLKHGANVDSYDYWYESALHNAAYTDNLEIARILLENGADPNDKNKFELTPSHIAFIHLNYEMVKLFSEYGADFTLKPFTEIDGGIDILDLLDQVSDYKHEEVKEFVVKLFPLLNFGYDNDDYKWGEKVEGCDPGIRAAQLTLVEPLLDFAPQVKISEYLPDFDYYNSETELDYAIDHADMEKIGELSDFILDNPDNIDAVLSADAFSDLKNELLNQWFEMATEEQYNNLKEYAKEYNDEDTLARIKADEKLVAEEDNEDNQDKLMLLSAKMKISHLNPNSPLPHSTPLNPIPPKNTMRSTNKNARK